MREIAHGAFASNHFGRIPGILTWAQSIGDVFFAFQHRSAYEEIRRQELEIEELKRQLQAAQMAVQNVAPAAGPSPQQRQWKQQAQQQRSKPTPDGGGRGDGASQQSARSDGRSQQKPTGNPQGAAQSSRPKRTGSSPKPNPRPNQKLLGAPPPPQGQQSQQKQSQAGTNGGNANLSVRDQYLVVLELTPGQTYTPDEIKTAWRKMAKKTHPDTGGSKAAFIQVVNAYNYLK